MRDEPYWASRVHKFRVSLQEAGWLEFKHNNAEPQEFGIAPEKQRDRLSSDQGSTERWRCPPARPGCPTQAPALCA